MARTDASAVRGLTLRNWAGEADVAEMARIRNADWAADALKFRETAEELAVRLRHPTEHFDPAHNVIVAEVDGRMVGHADAEWIDTTDGLREYRHGGNVDPEWRRRGIGRALLREAQRRMRELAATHETDRDRMLGLFTEDRQIGAAALARSEGYAPVRWFFEMERPLGAELPNLPALPAGIEVRAGTREEARTVWLADSEAFQDHWGGHDTSEGAFERWIEGPESDPSLWLVAWDGEQVAGAVINALYPGDAELGLSRGWLDSVFTRRAWRRRGLAGALIARSLHLLAERGLHTAALGVDADNPTGALRLYESLGFRVTERGTAWRRPLEA